MARFKYECSGCMATVYFDESIDTQRFFCPDSECGDLTLVLCGFTDGDAMEIIELQQTIESMRERIDALWSECMDGDVVTAQHS
ncbi:MAG: hypothetical protein E6R04_10715 [Spirochaetes bacterium]|nr:MAG: hypothetical protein E6R04_10715 [Spirochaetota bacterium]